MKPQVAVLYTEGINRDQESAFAFETAGAQTHLIHLTEFAANPKILEKFQILMAPGGFAHGDAIVAGKVMSTTLLYTVRDAIEQFVQRDTLTMGICNGFQVLLRTGLLPFGNIGDVSAALIDNDIGHLESRWIKLRVKKTNCVFTQGMEDQIIEVPISNGEGKFIAEDDVLDRLEENNQIVFEYVDDGGNATMEYPYNASAALRAIAGICNESGKIMGLMPHPECYTKKEQHPNWRMHGREPDCLPIFHNAVNYFN